MSTGFRWPESSSELGRKTRVYVMRCLTVVSDCTGARVEMISEVLYTNSTRTDIAHAHLPHYTVGDYVDYEYAMYITPTRSMKMVP